MSKEQELGAVACAVRRLPMKHSSEAAAITDRFPHKIALTFGMYLSVVEGSSIADTCFGLGAWRRDEKDSEWQMFDSRKEAEESGATLLHILSELEGS